MVSLQRSKINGTNTGVLIQVSHTCTLIAAYILTVNMESGKFSWSSSFTTTSPAFFVSFKMDDSERVTEESLLSKTSSSLDMFSFMTIRPPAGLRPFLHLWKKVIKSSAIGGGGGGGGGGKGL